MYVSHFFKVDPIWVNFIFQISKSFEMSLSVTINEYFHWTQNYFLLEMYYVCIKKMLLVLS
jgi:hypothetical protein